MELQLPYEDDSVSPKKPEGVAQEGVPGPANQGIRGTLKGLLLRAMGWPMIYLIVVYLKAPPGKE